MDEKISVDKDFLFELTEKVDNLTKTVEELERNKQPIAPITLGEGMKLIKIEFEIVTKGLNTMPPERQKMFLEDIRPIIEKYGIIELKLNTKKNGTL